MSFLLKVKTSAYKRLKNSDFIDYVRTLVQNGRDSYFDPFRSTIDAMSLAYDDFVAKHEMAKNRGELEIKLRNASRKDLTAAVDLYAKYIEIAALTDPTIITRAGFHQQMHTVYVPSSVRIQAPFNVRLKRGDNKGELRLTFVVDDTSLVVKYDLYWALEDSEDWTFKTFFIENPLIISNLPSRAHVKVKVRIIGVGNDNYSDYGYSNVEYVS